MPQKTDPLKKAAADRVFAPFELDQTRFENGIARLPRLYIGDQEIEYSFQRFGDLHGRIRIPNPIRGPRYFLVMVKEEI